MSGGILRWWGLTLSMGSRCSHGVFLYAGIGKQVGVWDEMSGARAKTNHDKCRGLSSVMHPSPGQCRGAAHVVTSLSHRRRTLLVMGGFPLALGRGVG